MKTSCLAAVATIAAVGCGSGPSADLGGTWTLMESFSGGGVSCEIVGELLIAHEAGSSLFGGIATRTATCTGAPNDFDPGGSDNIVGAEISGSDVSFDVDLCQYEGVVTDDMSGTHQCELGVGGATVQFTGTWTAVRTIN